jgi:nucleoid DNA-binding protein
MDIDLLSKMVKELILDKDRVVLPGLGSFVAEIVPSTFSDKGYTINPPYRRLFFRSRPDEGDELISFYASYNNVEREIADRIIRDFVKELKSVLHEKKTVVFPGLGRLRATKENNVFFVADETLDIYPEGFGLEPISLKTHQETAEEVTAAVEGLRSILAETAPVVAPVLEDAPLEQAVEVVPSVETVQAEPLAETPAEEVVAE